MQIRWIVQAYPKVKFDRKTMVEKICKKLGSEVLVDTNFLSIVKVGKAQISVSNRCEVIIREIESEAEAQELARKIMRVLNNS